MAKQKAKRLWLAREIQGGMWGMKDYSLHTYKPELDEQQGEWVSHERCGHRNVSSFCYNTWHRLTGIKLKPGELCRVEITQTARGFKFERVKK